MSAAVSLAQSVTVWQPAVATVLVSASGVLATAVWVPRPVAAPPLGGAAITRPAYTGLPVLRLPVTLAGLAGEEGLTMSAWGEVIPSAQNLHELRHLCDQNNNAVPATAVSVSLTVYDATHMAVVLGQPMAAGPQVDGTDGTVIFSYVSPASVWVAGAGPWEEHQQVKDPTGMILYRDFITIRYQAAAQF